MMRVGQFKDFVSFTTAFLQNLIGNILNFNTIYQNIVSANAANNTMNVYFYFGRLSYMIVYFDPIVDSPLTVQPMTPVVDIQTYLEQSSTEFKLQ